jgi:hypothetical protein
VIASPPRPPRTIGDMAFAAVIWHYWIGVVLFFAGVALIGPIVAGYLAKVVRPRYPSRRQRELQ